MRSSDRLPSETQTKSILSKLDTSSVSMVTGATGSGKSTKVPWMLAKNKRKVILCLPTRESVRNIHDRVSGYGDKSVSIGYAEGGKIHYDKSTDLIYATSGHVRNLMFRGISKSGKLEKGSILKDRVLILDEVHTGSIDNSAILGLWSFYDRNGSNTKLLLMTATPVSSTVTDVVVTQEQVTTISVDDPYTVTVNPINSFIPGTFTKDDLSSLKSGRYQGVLKKATEVMTLSQIDSPKPGHVMVFVPTIEEADRTRDELITKLKGKRVSIMSYHSKSPIEDLRKAAKPSNIVKLIICTNAAESSITIENVAVVIDSMRSMVSSVGPRGRPKLTEVIISPASSLQRKGRTGRTRDGVYVPCMDQERFSALLRSTRKDELEIMISNIDKFVLSFLAKSLQPEDWISVLRNDTQEAIRNSTVSRVSSAVSSLKLSGALSESGDVTDYGYFAASCPIDILQSSFLWKWINQHPDSAYWGCVLAVLQDSDTLGIFPSRSTLPKLSGPDSFSTVVNVWLELERSTNGSFSKKTDKNTMAQWTGESGLRYYPLVSIVEGVARVCSSYLRYFHKDFSDLQIPKASTSDLMRRAIPILSDVYSHLILNYKGVIDVGSPSRTAEHLRERTPTKGKKSIPIYKARDNRTIFKISNAVPCVDKQPVTSIIPLVELTLERGKISNYVSVYCYTTFVPTRYVIDTKFSRGNLLPKVEIKRERNIVDDGMDAFIKTLDRRVYPIRVTPCEHRDIFCTKPISPPSSLICSLDKNPPKALVAWLPQFISLAEEEEEEQESLESLFVDPSTDIYDDVVLEENYKEYKYVADPEVDSIYFIDGLLELAAVLEQ